MEITACTLCFINKRALWPWLAHLSPGSRGGDVVPLVKEDMSFYDISIYSSGPKFVQRNGMVCLIFDRGHHEEHFCEIILDLNKWFRRRFCLMIFKLWRPYCLEAWNRLCHFVRGHYEEHIL